MGIDYSSTFCFLLQHSSSSFWLIFCIHQWDPLLGHKEYSERKEWVYTCIQCACAGCVFILFSSLLRSVIAAMQYAAQHSGMCGSLMHVFVKMKIM